MNNIVGTLNLGLRMGDLFAAFMASGLLWLLFGGLLFLWIVDGRVKRELALHAFLASLLAFVVVEMAKNVFPTLRPFHINGDGIKTLTVPNGGSFPSTHSAVAFGLSTAIWLHDKKLGVVFILGAVLVAIGRIVANVHYPIDVVGGGVFGIATALLFDRLHVFGLLKRRK